MCVVFIQNRYTIDGMDEVLYTDKQYTQPFIIVEYGKHVIRAKEFKVSKKE